MTLREKRCAFTELLCELVIWCTTVKGWKVAFDEVRVITPRRVRIGKATQIADDAGHIRNSYHYQGLAADLLLYDDLDGDGEQDDYVANGGDPRWHAIGQQWESLDPLCVSGLRFGDPNHCSYGGEARRDKPLP